MLREICTNSNSNCAVPPSNDDDFFENITPRTFSNELEVAFANQTALLRKRLLRPVKRAFEQSLGDIFLDNDNNLAINPSYRVHASACDFIELAGRFYLFLLSNCLRPRKPYESEIDSPLPGLSKLLFQRPEFEFDMRHLKLTLEARLSYSRDFCEEALNQAINRYHIDLPSEYRRDIHKTHLQAAVETYLQRARGDKVIQYFSKLIEDCQAVSIISYELMDIHHILGIALFTPKYF